jgi:uncharacterized repeat protein (TIGR03833 family)
MMPCPSRQRIRPGMAVLIVKKEDQRSGKLTAGVVQDILTRSPNHPHGIKVRLQGGEVGRVKEIANDSAPESTGGEYGGWPGGQCR